MYISKIKLANWRNFKEVDISLEHRVFIVGPNASGKSNFLGAVRFLRDIVKQAGGLQYAVEERGGVAKIRYLFARQKTGISIEMELSEEPGQEPEWIYKLVFTHSNGGGRGPHAVVVEENVWSKKENKWVLDRQKNSPGEDPETLKFTHLQQVHANAKFREVYHFFQDTQYLHIVPHLVREADAYTIAPNKEDYYGRTLLTRMSKTRPAVRNAYIEEINRVMQVVVPQLENLEFKKDGKGVPHLEALYKHWRDKGARQQETEFSDGTLRLIGFMWALLDGEETVLLEEPELYLHTAVVKQLPEFIAKLQEKKDNTRRQVIITTHSYDLLSGEGIGSDEVVLLKPADEGTKLERVDKIEQIGKYLEAGFSMAEAVMPAAAPADVEQMLHTGFEDR
jgi:predicted ATPase